MESRVENSSTFGETRRCCNKQKAPEPTWSGGLFYEDGEDVTLSKEQADYIGVSVDGPYKADHYRY